MLSAEWLNSKKQANRGKPRVLVVGLDGATWSSLDPLLAQNKLPVLSKLLTQGSRSNLRSCIQPSSEQAWSAFATGKQNGKFGIFGFYQRARGSYALEYVNASHRRAPTLWRLLSDRGKRCVVVDVPITWPVEPVNGALVSGFMTPGLNSEFTYPRELKAELLSELGDYIIDVDTERGASDDRSLAEFAAEVRWMSELQTRAAEWLLARYADWELAVVVYRAPDILGHKFWRYQDPGHPLYEAKEAAKWGSVIAEGYQYLDGMLGRLLAAAAYEQTSVIVLSDHGFGPLTHAVYLNRYLAGRGLLAYRPRSGSALGRALRAGLGQLNNPLFNAAKLWAFEHVPQLKGRLHSTMAFGSFDWSRTRAFAVGTMGNVYLNVRGREPEGIVEPREYEATRDRVIDALRALTDPEDGRPIFDAVYRREAVYQGSALEQAPDVIGLIDGPYHIAAVDWRAEGNTGQVVEKAGRQLQFVSDTSGQHRMDGILAAAGVGIAPRAQFSELPRLIDLAPTVLQLLGEPVPEDMDGRVLVELLSMERAVEYGVPTEVKESAHEIYSEAEAKQIEERLAGLGYLG